MRVQRYPARPKRWPAFWGCGCLTIMAGGALMLVIVVLLVLPTLPALGLRMAGLSPKGQTDTAFANWTPVPTVQLENPVAPPEVVVDLGAYGGSQNVAGSTDAYQVAVESGGQLATATFTEDGLMTMCHQLSEFCSNANSQYRNVRIDLRPGGAVIYADVTVPDLGITQTVGLVMRLDSSRTRFEVVGIDVGGALYDVAASNFSGMVTDFERVGNDILGQLTLQAGGGQYSLSEAYADDTTLTLVLR
jgi:hypothetical protein